MNSNLEITLHDLTLQTMAIASLKSIKKQGNLMDVNVDNITFLEEESSTDIDDAIHLLKLSDLKKNIKEYSKSCPDKDNNNDFLPIRISTT